MKTATSSKALSVRRGLERSALLAARVFVDDMRARYRVLEKQTGASITMHRALACIAKEPGISATRLASALGMKKPAVSHLLKALSGRGWMDRVRTDEDQRSVQLRLSQAGTRIMDATGGRAVGTLQRAVSELTDEEVAALSKGLAALLRELSGSVDPERRS